MPGQIDVLLVGTFHMDNPGRDMGNVHVDDMLSERRQSEIQAVVEALAKFEPTKVAVEYPTERQAELDAAVERHRSDQLELRGHEIHQLGFRIARAADARMVAIDVLDVFYDPAIETFTEQHQDLAPYLARMWSDSEEEAATHTQFLAEHSVFEVLRAMNAPSARQDELRPYIEHLVPIGRGDDYPGPEMVGYWYRRNFKIVCNLFAAVEDGDRVLVVYGAGHIPVLEHTLQMMSSMNVVSTLDYLK